MKRVLLVTLLLSAAAAYVLVGTGAGEDDVKRYTVEFDNAFGLVEGGDVKIAGVRAGRVSFMDVDRKTKRALVGLEITKPGFGDLRDDVRCESRPQSLIGEYFIDCFPGTSPKRMPEGSKIPVDRTSSTISADLVNNIMRRPFRERLRIIIGELGAGVGGRAEELNDAIRRASPALRETEQVLEILGRQNRILRDLVTNADRVIGDLAENRRDVVRFVKETGETAAASAERRADIEAGFRRLPGFLRELRPTMAELGEVAERQQPSLRDLNASAGELEELFENLGPFADSTRVNLRSLAAASGPGRRAARSALPTLQQLTKFAEPTPELSKNLAIALNHLNDRDFGVEPDPRAPDPAKGFSGFENLLYYVYIQSLVINIFDQNGYMLKVNLFEGECSEYQNAESLKEHMQEDPQFYERCAARLGPNQPGITTPDPTLPPGGGAGERRAKRRDAVVGDRPGDGPGVAEPRKAGDRETAQPPAAAPPVNLLETLDEILPDPPKLPDPPRLPQGGTSRDLALLDYLFGR